jgi:hypothetical protein
MTEAERREIHELIGRASDGEAAAVMAIEQRVIAFEKAGAADDTVYVLDRLSLIGMGDLRQRIVAALLASGLATSDDRPTWLA